MLSNKVKRNLWLTLAIMSLAAVIDRAFRLAAGDIEWWQLLSPIVITLLFTRFYFCYRRAVKEGNLFGKVCTRRKRWIDS